MVRRREGTHGDDFIEVKEHSGVSLGTSDETKSISKSCYDTLQQRKAWV